MNTYLFLNHCPSLLLRRIPLVPLCCAIFFQSLTATAQGPVTAASSSNPAPLQAASPPKPVELLQVEAVMGRPMDREYQRYATVAQLRPELDSGFADFLYEDYTRRRNSGIILAGVATPLVLGFTGMGVIALYRSAKEDEGGFCNHEYYDEFTEEYETDCKGDYGEVTGIILISTLGVATAAALFLPGLIKILKYNKRIRRLEPLAAPLSSRQNPSRLSWEVSPSALTLGLTF